MANITVRIDETKKGAAEAVVSRLGMTMSDAVKLFLDALIQKETMPFDVTLSESPDGRVVHRALGDIPENKSMGTHAFAEALAAFQIRNFLGAKVRRVGDNPVVDLEFSIGNERYACLVKGRQFSINESLQDKVLATEVEELKRYARRQGCQLCVAFVMLDPDGREGNTYLFDPEDFDRLSEERVMGITGSLTREGEIRVSNAPRNRRDLQSREGIVSFYYKQGPIKI